MKILMVTDVYFPRVNGVSTSIQTFSRSFLEQGHEVTIIAPAYPGDDDAEFDIMRIPSWQVPLDPEDRFMHIRHIKRQLLAIRDRGFDIIHIHTPFVAHYAGVWLARKLELPVVVSYHTFFEAYLEKYLPWLPHSWLRGAARRFSRKQCNKVDGIISPSRQMLAKLREYGVEQTAAVIPTGLRLEQFAASGQNDFRENYGIPEDACLLLYLGRVAHEKNIEFLVDMFEQVVQQVPQAHMVIAGEGPAEASLKKRVHKRQLQDSIHFIGYLKPIRCVVDCYRASDLFVFASETETQGLVLLEAMACGVPVISCACLGSKDVLIEGEGCMISPLQTGAFANKVISLAEDPVRSSELAARGEDYVSHWGSASKSAEMLAFYQQLVANRASLAEPAPVNAIEDKLEPVKQTSDRG